MTYMNEQSDMFTSTPNPYGYPTLKVRLNDTPVVRAGNPLTSFQGETYANVTGRQTHARLLLEAIGHERGLIRAELSVRTGLSEYECSKRLSDLKNLGMIEAGPSRKASGGRSQQTWFLAGGAR
jgi:hypothetical protein